MDKITIAQQQYEDAVFQNLHVLTYSLAAQSRSQMALHLHFPEKYAITLHSSPQSSGTARDSTASNQIFHRAHMAREAMQHPGSY